MNILNISPVLSSFLFGPIFKGFGASITKSDLKV